MDKLIDCHFHIWDLERNYYPWLTDQVSENITQVIGDYSRIRRNYLIEDFRRDIGDLNVVAAVHLQADVTQDDSVNESVWLQEVADGDGSGMPEAFVARGNLGSPDAAKIITEHCEFPNMRGLRVEMHPGLGAPSDYDPLKDQVWLSNFALLKQHDLVFEVRAASPEQTAGVIRLMQDNPDTTFVFPHLGLSVWRDEESIAAWRRNLKVYGGLPNVYIKLSGYGLFGPQWTIDEVRPYVMDCIDAMGADKLVCGSNYPVDSIASSYRRIWDTHADLLARAGCSQADTKKIYHDNAKQLYQL